MTTTQTTKGLARGVHCYLDGARGQYIPRDFARDTKRDCISGVKPEDLDYLARGPGGCLDEDKTLADGETVRGEFYWDTWDDVCDNAVLTDPISGNKFRLHQDGDLFLVPEDWEFNEDTGGFEPPESDTLNRFGLYSHWASYLVNGDDSGISAEDKAACDSFISREELTEWTCANVSENTHFGSPDCGGLQGDIARYTFVKI